MGSFDRQSDSVLIHRSPFSHFADGLGKDAVPSGGRGKGPEVSRLPCCVPAMRSSFQLKDVKL